MKKINHIGIAVHSIEEAAAFYCDCLGLKLTEVIDIPARQIRAALLETPNGCLELIEPWEENEAVRNFLSRRGEGINHIAFQVKDIDGTVKIMKAQGVIFVTESPVIGAHGRRIIFISPKSTHGVLIELCESADSK